MPKVTEAYLEERRKQIIDAAIVCFAKKGFHKTTMEDIGQEAGLSATVAYRYFDSKDDIIVATVERGIERRARYLESLDENEDIRLVMEQLIDDYYQRLEEPNREIYYKVRLQLWAETVRNTKVAERARLRREDGVIQQATLIERGQKRGLINPYLDARTIAVAIMASFDGFILQWLADPEIDVDEYREAHKAMVRGLFSFQG